MEIEYFKEGFGARGRGRLVVGFGVGSGVGGSVARVVVLLGATNINNKYIKQTYNTIQIIKQ